MIFGTYITGKGEALAGPTYDQITERFKAMIHDMFGYLMSNSH